MDCFCEFIFCAPAPNGMRYPRVGGVWIHSEGSINPKPGKCLKMPQTPTRRVHALLGAVELEDSLAKKIPPPTQKKFTYT
jgi:hypothetical protein